MNPFVFVMRRPLTTLILVAVLISGGVFGLNTMRADSYPPHKTPKIYTYLDYATAHAKKIKGFIVGKVDSYFRKSEEEHHETHHKIVATSPKAKDVTITQKYVCQIHSKQHTMIRALEGGYLEQIMVREGQTVKKDDPMFKIVPTLYQARLEAEQAEARVAELEYKNTEALYNNKAKVVSQQEVAIYYARMLKAKAKADLARAELNFTIVKAPFDGIVDRQHEQLGSLIKEGDVLTSLSDNSVMWVYFNVPERDYLKYMAEVGQDKESPDIALELANHNKFPQTGKIGAIESDFNNETGNISFRADFENPKRLLRNGQTGTVLISRLLKDALVIPQRATFENLAKRYVYIVGDDEVVHQHEIEIENELEDNYVIKAGLGLDVKNKIVLEGIRQVHDGAKVEFEFLSPDEVMKNQKNKAE